MADIQNNVEGSGNSSTMTWVVVVLVLIILAIVGYFMFYRGNSYSAPTSATPTNIESATYNVTLPPSNNGTSGSSTKTTTTGSLNTNTSGSLGY